VRGPGAIRAYLRGEWRGIGHNPIGALSVLGLLALVGAQAATGLFTNDDIAFQGPFADWSARTLSDSFHSWHAWLQNGLLALIVLHVGRSPSTCGSRREPGQADDHRLEGAPAITRPARRGAAAGWPSSSPALIAGAATCRGRRPAAPPRRRPAGCSRPPGRT
jgi:hypothetical protein